jgi:methyl-accepting chemotaxis protein
MPTWVGVVTAISLAIIALAAVVVAVAAVLAARGANLLFGTLRRIVGPAIDDVRGLIANIRAEADALVGTSRDIRLRIVEAADAAEARLADLDALAEVVQQEVEETALDAAATLRSVRRGLYGFRWARRVLARRRRPD